MPQGFPQRFSDKQENGTIVYLNANNWELFFLIGLTVVLSTGCALIGGGTEIEHASGYSVTPPDGWSRQSRGDSDYAYRLPSGNVVTLVSSCNRNPDAPLDVLTRHLLMGTRDVAVKKREKMTLGSNEGLHSQVLAKLQGHPFHLEVFVLTKNRCVFDFALMSPEQITESDSAGFKEFVTSFKYGKD